MTTFPRWSAGLILAFSMISPPLAASPALSTAAETPPIKVEGFAHKYLSRGRIHMNTCEVEICDKGASVSYQFEGPREKPNFDEFKKRQKLVATHIKQQAPKGTVIKLGSEVRHDRPTFTLFSGDREITTPNGGTLYTKSTTVHGKRMTISVISSASSAENAERNGSHFIAGLMAWAGMFRTAAE